MEDDDSQSKKDGSDRGRSLTRQSIRNQSRSSSSPNSRRSLSTSSSSSSNSSDYNRRKRRRRRKRKKRELSRPTKYKKRRKKRSQSHSISSSSSTDSSSSSSSDESDNHRRKRRKRKRHKSKKKRKIDKKKRERQKEICHSSSHKKKDNDEEILKNEVGKDEVPTNNTIMEPSKNEETVASVQKRKMMIPMTREEYEKQQNTVKEVYDPESGRVRLIRGTGEIIERIVSRSNHECINKIATRGDGMNFARNIATKSKFQN